MEAIGWGLSGRAVDLGGTTCFWGDGGGIVVRATDWGCGGGGGCLIDPGLARSAAKML